MVSASQRQSPTKMVSASRRQSPTKMVSASQKQSQQKWSQPNSQAWPEFDSPLIRFQLWAQYGQHQQGLRAVLTELLVEQVDIQAKVHTAGQVLRVRWHPCYDLKQYHKAVVANCLPLKKKNLKQSWLPAFWKKIQNTQEVNLKRMLFNWTKPDKSGIDSGRKIPCRTWELNLPQPLAGLMLYTQFSVLRCPVKKCSPLKKSSL